MNINTLLKLIKMLDDEGTTTADGPENGANAELQSNTHPWEIGKKYFIRTVTMHISGELVSVDPQELVLKDAAWVADSGRFSEAIKDPDKFKEVEPFQRPVIVGRGSIVDATEIPNIITEVK